MFEERKTEDIDKLLGSVEEFADQAKLLALNLASAVVKARSIKKIPSNLSDDLYELVSQTVKTTEDIIRMIKIVKMEMSGLFTLEDIDKTKAEKEKEIREKIETSLRMILLESQRVLDIMKRFRPISVDDKFA